MMTYDYIKENLKTIKNKIAAAAAKADREANEITLVAVSKTHPADTIKAAVEYGAADIGEARIQESEPKIISLGNIARWHLIGHLQKNKVKKAVRLFDLIQSVDSLKLAEEINHRAGEIGKKIDCLLEVNSSGEESKYGVRPDEAIEIIEKVNRLENVNLVGLMTIGPFVEDKETIREVYRNTRELFLKGREIAGDLFAILSMGMSDDYEIAIEEGSNMVRVGTAIFGPREKWQK